MSVMSPEERLLTAAQLAPQLGVKTRTVLRWFETGRLPGFKLGGGPVRFRESEIEEWLESQRRAPGAEAVRPSSRPPREMS